MRKKYTMRSYAKHFSAISLTNLIIYECKCKLDSIYHMTLRSRLMYDFRTKAKLSDISKRDVVENVIAWMYYGT